MVLLELLVIRSRGTTGIRRGAIKLSPLEKQTGLWSPSLDVGQS